MTVTRSGAHRIGLDSMPDIVIENPVINSPYDEPRRHFVFSDDGITGEIADSRRISSYFIPIPPPKRRGGQELLPGDWLGERIKSNEFINRVRERVSIWRRGGCQGITPITGALLDYWRNPERDRPLFFCQVEALETAIYMAEVANRYGDGWIENRIREANEASNPGLFRIAFKMATGSGKTVVMAMLIAWQVLNKLAYPQDRRFGDSFLVVTPGITIRDRLRVLVPNDPNNYYVERDLVTSDQLQQLQRAKILITNFHAFIRVDKVEAASLTKKVLAGPSGNPEAFKETPDEMVRRVCRAFGNKRNLVVINDEAHHCYREKLEDGEGKLEPDERSEAEANTEAARVWISGLEAIRAKLGLRAIYDLSATPFFLRGSGYPEGTLFPWVVSDFSLIDAIESGIVKVPRVPVADNQMLGPIPTYRDLWLRVREHLPRKGRSLATRGEEPHLPKELEGALRSLYGDYEKSFHRWRELGFGTPPVFIVVCSNTAVSKLVFDWIAGWQKTLDGAGTALVPGNLDLFSNVDGDAWVARPNTLLIDSAQLEAGTTMDDAFKKAVAVEIDRFKEEYRVRLPDRDVEKITDEDLLREVMNTVGKPGRLGEQVRCVVSVSMLTEGWDANTVTHILGVRAFGTQLLCEQVIGRGLRRSSYSPNQSGFFDPEYAEIYGVPFSFLPVAGTSEPRPPKEVHRVQAMPERAAAEITFPRVLGYRYVMPAERLEAKFGAGSRMTLSTREVPTLVELDPVVGKRTVHDLNELHSRRYQEVAFRIAKLTLDEHFRDEDGNERPWLFPQLLAITHEWMLKCVVCKDDAFPQMLLLSDLSHAAAERIHRSIMQGTSGEKRLLPVLKSFDAIGSTRFVAFDTIKEVWSTDPLKCHLNYVALDSGWEAKLAQTLEAMSEVICYVKNQGLNFAIPYTLEGQSANYWPDYIVRIAGSSSEPLNLIVEVSGRAKKDKAAKVATASQLWVPAINNHGGLGRWGFVEVRDPWDAAHKIRRFLVAEPNPVRKS